jgi:hypothetical protein
MFVNGRSQVSSADIYREFRVAIRDRDYDAAKKAAQTLPGQLSQLDSLELTLLANEAGRPNDYEAFAARWLARVTVECNLKLGQLAMAADICRAAGKGEAKDAFKSLVSYAKDI